jgi:hypothetical protein
VNGSLVQKENLKKQPNVPKKQRIERFKTTNNTGLPQNFFKISRNDERQRQKIGKHLYFFIDCHTLAGSQ